MEKVRIPKEEFLIRKQRLLDAMYADNLDLLVVYGDEYRKENLRYVSNFWPLFERGAVLFSNVAQPIVLCAPEGLELCREMCVWDDIRVIPDFLCVTVPDEIDYPHAGFTSFRAVADQLREKGCKLERMGVAGLDAMSCALTNSIMTAFNGQLVDANDILIKLRKTKSENEIACLREAARIADIAYKRFMEIELIGMTEIEAAGIIEAAARANGAEHIIFNVLGTGKRTDTIIGRPAYKVIEDGDMVMCAIAVQYEGYVATCEIPFAVGNYSEETRRVIDVLMRAYDAGLPYLKPGEKMKNFVCAVKEVFKAEGLSQYDVYPPLHGIGCAEAESPYPNEYTEEVFTTGMTVNTDISLFGLPGGSNRIEVGFVITESGAQTLSPIGYEYCRRWLSGESAGFRGSSC